MEDMGTLPLGHNPARHLPISSFTNSTMSSLVKNVPSDAPESDAGKITPLDFEKVRQLPDSYVWTPDHPTVDPTLPPTVDLEDPNAVNTMRRACEEWGLFYITNHGVPISLVNEMENQTMKLFQLPTEDKMRALRLPGDMCGYGTAAVSKNCPRKTWSEGFTLKGPPFLQARKLSRPQQDHDKFCEVVEKYQEQVDQVRKKVMEVLLSSLGLAHQDLDWLQNKESQVIHLNSYPVCPDPIRTVGMLPHTDSPFVTLLHQGNIAGLQVLKDKTGWVPLQPLNGALTVILGDMMHVLTNGRLRSPLHRVAVNNLHHRVSVVYFYGPAAGVEVAPLVKLLKDGEGPKYRGIKLEELLDLKQNQLKDPIKAISL